ncbi:MAG: 30S ribosomal protein S18 [Planctomycetota bacterium]
MPRQLKRNNRNSSSRDSGPSGRPKTQRRRTGPPGGREQTQCRFCRGRVKYIDYKDINTLQKLLTNRGKIYSRKRSGNCAGCQRKAKKAIKRARYMALLPFTA